MDAHAWDSRYLERELVWGAPPNATVVEFATALPPGRVLDLGTGEGRNALWLAGRGWQVDAVDFSQVGIDKGRTIATRLSRAVRDRVEWRRADVTRLDPEFLRTPYDLILMVFLHLPSEQRHALVGRLPHWLAPGGTLLVVGHDSANPGAGVGGPQDPEILFTPADIVLDLGGLLEIQLAETRIRPTEAGDALDALVVATGPLSEMDSSNSTDYGY